MTITRRPLGHYDGLGLQVVDVEGGKRFLLTNGANGNSPIVIGVLIKETGGRDIHLCGDAQAAHIMAEVREGMEAVFADSNPHVVKAKLYTAALMANVLSGG